MLNQAGETTTEPLKLNLMDHSNDFIDQVIQYIREVLSILFV